MNKLEIHLTATKEIGDVNKKVAKYLELHKNAMISNVDIKKEGSDEDKKENDE